MAVTTGLFPLLYLTLELPKRIINDAIGAETDVIDIWGYQLNQIPFLAALCVVFLIAILAHGILKMRINTMKGVLSERMLRRFRYTLIERILRFPQPYFKRTSQAELVSMVTSEAEPLGGLMGDAIAQPILQAGQMITILFFLFMQSFWFGLAAVALIPLQAWLIPKLQRRVNLLNKDRIQEVRKLAAEIGENAAGSSSMRTNGGWRYRMAMISSRLGILFNIRFQIYQKKFFMKFINNFITQLTPFFFFSIGGYLVIKGNISLGALVAALAAYKDLSSPWKELLAYYNQVQDMTLRWQIITERFAPKGMVDETLFAGEPEEIIRLSGDINLKDVTVRDSDGITVLEDINATIPQKATVGITSTSETDRRAFAELLTREILPTYGDVTIGDKNLSDIHQTTLAARIGHANSTPHVFDGTVGDNVTMPLRRKPRMNGDMAAFTHEAKRSGNSPDQLDTEWLDPNLAGFEKNEDVGDWWLKTVEGLGTGNALFRRGLDQCFEESSHKELAQRLIELRPVVGDKIKEAGLQKLYYCFKEDLYNPELPVAGNLLFATPRMKITQKMLAGKPDFLPFLRELDLDVGLLELSKDVIEMLNQIFGTDGTDHPLFRKLDIDVAFYETAVELVGKTKVNGTLDLNDEEVALLLTVPFSITAQQIGPAFSDDMKSRILSLRTEKGALLQERFDDLFAPIAIDHFLPSLTVLENVLFGKINQKVGSKAQELKDLVAQVLLDAGMKRLVSELIYDFKTGLDGSNLPSFFAQRLSYTRATIKRPDVLIMERAMIGSDIETRSGLPAKMRELMPDTTHIFIDDKFEDTSQFDMLIELEDGRIKNSKITGASAEHGVGSTDLTKKLKALSTADLFANLDRKQLRLLAFGAQWYEAEAGEMIFTRGEDASDGAYLVLSGQAGLYYPRDDDDDELISTVEPGRLVGDASLLLNKSRRLHMKAHEKVTALRIGREEFLAVVENDAQTSFSLLRTVSGHLDNVVERIRSDDEAVTDK